MKRRWLARSAIETIEMFVRVSEVGNLKFKLALE